MPSPFPGMDPYLEKHWGDVHARLIIYACDQLQERLPKDLRARVEERVVLESPESGDYPFIPDVRLIEERPRKTALVPSAGGVAVAEPLIVQGQVPVTETFIEIRDAATGMRLVTSIEVFSPSNKMAGEGWQQYRKKQRLLRRGRISSVELDLLRAGKRRFPLPLESIPAAHRTPYLIWVRRGWEPVDIEVYRVPLRERLPAIRIPLRQKDADVPLDLQALIEECYRKGGYDNTIDYTAELIPPLRSGDATWVDDLLRGKGLRPAKRRPKRGRS